MQWCSAVRKTQLAVPFHACDVPSERSDFKHADVALVKTVIAYDERGLDLEQMNDMLRARMDLEDSQRGHLLVRSSLHFSSLSDKIKRATHMTCDQ
jgi:Protein of unknown function (DUF3645)